MTMSRDSAVLLFLLIVAGVLPVWAQSTQAASSTSTEVPLGPSAHALQISAGDLLDLNVFDTPELSTKLRVDENGNVSLPLAGGLPVSGMTAEQARLAIEARLRETDILKDPHVSVTVLEYATQGITVAGEVRNPGIYPLLGAHGLVDLISAAGGVTPNAGNAVTVTHRSDPGYPVVTNVFSKPGSTAGFSVDVRPGVTIKVSHT